MNGALQDKVAIVTGGSAGIGLTISRRFCEEGARLLIGDLQEPPAALSSNPQVTYLPTDVASEADVAAVVSLATTTHGRVDVLVNNAGYGGVMDKLTELDMEKADTTISVLLKGVLHGYKHAGAVVKAQGGGSITSIASVAGLVGGAAPAVYSACKAAVAHLAKCAVGSVARAARNEGLNMCRGGFGSIMSDRK